jgi:DNA-binding MarR family transcriptional regulator
MKPAPPPSDLPQTARTQAATTRTLAPGLMADRLSFRVRSVLGLLGSRVTEAFLPFGLRPGSFTSMALISANPGCSQAELAREGGIDKTSVVFIVNDLEERGLAIRGRTPNDKRRSSLSLTAEGDRVMREMYEAAMATEASLRDRMSGDEMQTLFALLEKAYTILAEEDPSR